MDNFLKIPAILPDEEYFQTILSNQNLKIERIISRGQTTPEDQWYDQERDEWVILLQGEAELSYQDGSKIRLKGGDYLLIPAHEKHRVDYTSIDPPCIWLAIHANLASIS
ncbi:cupin domain-containing protein [Gloeothece verrucosa]|uniref:Cupin 2 conserved barrel domain protein n=1 Tax=Gloeothece verrucosa (strain PCC 7822) TaxID=497965 RepID=E0U625_GLOV7|nr:cupin domain-containing protein [Gloeothece verrucosa]ADN17134.1 Cupin 2 conserved barrel domain protein [Gloeothece verrucosa PCC 7822]